MYLRKEIKLDERSGYLKKILIITLIVGITDLLITIVINTQIFFSFFSLRMASTTSTPLFDGLNFVPLLIMILILLLLITIQFISFILKRSVQILKQYWITILLLLVASLSFTLFNSISKLGWYENSHARLLFFSWPYIYVGWIFLAFLLITIFCNAISIILYNILDKFVNPIKYKQQLVTFLKLGFTAAIGFTLLSVTPNLLLWFYT
jgi:hypothetical protein